MSRKLRRHPYLLLILALYFAPAPSLKGATVTFGYVSYNFDDPINGQNSFVLNNFTGPALGCSFDFEICDNISIASASLLIDYTDAFGAPQSLTRALDSPVLPGSFTPANFIFDAAAFTIIGARFAGTIAPVSVLLNDGSTFNANPAFDTLIDLPGGGVGLLQLSSVSDGNVPEPATFLLIAATVPLLLRRRR